MEKAFEVQKQIRDNAKTLNTSLTDLQNWESEMKRKEAALKGEFEQELPPIRSKIKKERPVRTVTKPAERIPSSDYTSWDKFDVDKACEEVDMEEVGPTSLDSKKSEQDKMEKLREEAHYEKERGNGFVKQEKWDEAIKCYSRAIDLYKDDAIYFANRGLCYLKKDKLHQAEKDCTEALRLDPTYVKALQRRASAREKLGSLRSASDDLIEVLRLEPHNVAAKKQLEILKARRGVKGLKTKSSPVVTPTAESKPITSRLSTAPDSKVKIVELPDTEAPKVVEKKPTMLDNWRLGVGENVTVIRPVKKPPHLRSKRLMKTVQIQEIPLGKTAPEKPPTRLKIVELEDNKAQGDSNNNDSNKDIDTVKDKIDTKGEGDKMSSPESEKLIIDTIIMEKDVFVEKMVPPMNSVQFMADWKVLKGKGNARSDYLSIIDPAKIPRIFENALESDVISDVIHILADEPAKFKEKTVSAYLKALCQVKRFTALVMFLSTSDKESLNKLLNHCKAVENCNEDEISDLRNKFEL